MHITFYSELPTTPTYIDPPLDQAGGDVDGDSFHFFEYLSSLFDRPLVGTTIFEFALGRWIQRDSCIGHRFFSAVEGMDDFLKSSFVSYLYCFVLRSIRLASFLSRSCFQSSVLQFPLQQHIAQLRWKIRRILLGNPSLF